MYIISPNGESSSGERWWRRRLQPVSPVDALAPQCLYGPGHCSCGHLHQLLLLLAHHELVEPRQGRPCIVVVANGRVTCPVEAVPSSNRHLAQVPTAAAAARRRGLTACRARRAPADAATLTRVLVHAAADDDVLLLLCGGLLIYSISSPVRCSRLYSRNNKLLIVVPSHELLLLLLLSLSLLGDFARTIILLLPIFILMSLSLLLSPQHIILFHLTHNDIISLYIYKGCDADCAFLFLGIWCLLFLIN